MAHISTKRLTTEKCDTDLLISRGNSYLIEIRWKIVLGDEIKSITENADLRAWGTLSVSFENFKGTYILYNLLASRRHRLSLSKYE